jgi:hypothetical protein
MDGTGVVLSMLGSVKVLVSKDDLRSQGAIQAERIMSTEMHGGHPEKRVKWSLSIYERMDVVSIYTPWDVRYACPLRMSVTCVMLAEVCEHVVLLLTYRHNQSQCPGQLKGPTLG